MRPLLDLLCSLLRVLVIALVLSGTAHAQTKVAASVVVGDKDKEEEASDSPRVSMRSFLELVERGRYQDAAIYLDLPKGTDKRGAELAARLYAVLSQRLLVAPEQLSPLAHGKPTDGLPAGTEELGKIEDAKGRPVPIRLVRHEPKAADDEPRWVFSQSTILHVDLLYNELGDRWIRDHLPPSLLVQGPYGLYLWQWLALPLFAALCIGGGRFLSYASGLVFARFFRNQAWGERFLSTMKKPTTLGWALVLFALVLPNVALTLRAEDVVDRGLRALAYLAFFWALLRTVGVLGDQLALGVWGRSHPSARSVSSIGVRLGKVIVAALALTVFLSELGFPVTSVVAGLGIGGVALALAAQKTVENLFGSVSILVDRPFNVGDWIRVDTIEGRVETIGLRSTRVRTFDRTLVILPNGKLADMRIESVEAREWIRFTTRLQLARTTTEAQLKAIIANLWKELDGHDKVRREDLSVRLAGIGDASYDVDVAAHVDTIVWSEYARIREDLLYRCIAAVDKVGSNLAIPTRQLVEAVKPPSPGRA